MSEPHAVIGRYQLKRLPEFIAARRRVAAIYDRGLAAIGVTPLPLSDRRRSATTTSTSRCRPPASIAPR